MENPEISIVLRTYNRAHLLQRAIRSVQWQTRQDFQLIIVDDCSTDRTREVIAAYAAKDRRIVTLLRDVNSRNAPEEVEPMNDGLRLCRGNYIAYLDDDNQWRPRYLELMSRHLIEHPECVLVYCDSCDHRCAATLQDQLRYEERTYSTLSDSCVLVPHLPKFEGLQFFSSGSGYRDYLDTNEMMNTKAALDAIGGLWPIRHKQAPAISMVQGDKLCSRRHHDLAFAEMLLARFGPERLHYLPEVLVDSTWHDCSYYSDVNVDLYQYAGFPNATLPSGSSRFSGGSYD